MNNAIQIIAAVAILGLGIWIGTLFSGCDKKRESLIVQRVDTLVIDTSKIIYKTPIVIRQVTTNESNDCWNTLPVTINEHGDTLSIDSVNSCKGIYKGIRQGYRPDTVRYAVAKVIRDTVRETIEILKGGDLNFGIIAKLGSGFGMVGGIGMDFNLSYKDVGINVSPSLYYLDKFRGFVFIGATYRIK